MERLRFHKIGLRASSATDVRRPLITLPHYYSRLENCKKLKLIPMHHFGTTYA
jgi:hypothetical protein